MRLPHWEPNHNKPLSRTRHVQLPSRHQVFFVESEESEEDLEIVRNSKV
jgi:hypothetical protein